MFKMKPNIGALVASGVVLLLGVLFFFDSISDPGDIAAHGRGKLTLAVSIVISGLLFIISTGRMWFKHLWHDRYR
ncbi:hypothetical protein [Pontiella sp.]|uniref:hypothetical protein n=1 Tax=Pontiella sp. TaxID=2837462 RepID=UPI00356238D3